MAKELAAVSGAPVKLSWGAIFGGTFVALGVWVLLYTLGLAIGLTSIDRSESLRSILQPSIGTGLWSLITPLIALFVGGLVASRTAGIVDRVAGAVHGAVLWGLTTVLAVMLVAWGTAAVINALVNVGQTAVSAAGGAVSGLAQGGTGAAQALNLNMEDALAPVNQRLREQGQPPITAQQLQASVQDAINTSLQQGRFDRQLLVNALAQNTALSSRDVNEIAGNLEAQFNQSLQQVGQQLQQGAATAAQTTGKVFWILFISQLLSLVSAVLGASIGVTRRQRLAAQRLVPNEPAAPPPGSPPRREVYP